jgi:hypothetical protein
MQTKKLPHFIFYRVKNVTVINLLIQTIFFEIYLFWRVPQYGQNSSSMFKGAPHFWQ